MNNYEGIRAFTKVPQPTLDRQTLDITNPRQYFVFFIFCINFTKFECTVLLFINICFLGFLVLNVVSRVCYVQGLSCLGFVVSMVCYVQGLSCLGSVMSSVCYVQGLLCLVFVMSRVCYVQGLSCLGFVMSRVCRVQGLSCLGFVMSRVCRVQGLSCLGSVVSRVCRVQGLSCLGFCCLGFVVSRVGLSRVGYGTDIAFPDKEINKLCNCTFEVRKPFMHQISENNF